MNPTDWFGESCKETSDLDIWGNQGFSLTLSNHHQWLVEGNKVKEAMALISEDELLLPATGNFLSRRKD